MNASPADPLRPLFDWASHEEGKGWLFFWVVAAALLHFGVYFLFRISYPPVSFETVPEAELLVVLPGSRERSLLWSQLEAADPALFAPERRAGLAPAGPIVPLYQPSFDTSLPQIRTGEGREREILPPMVQPLGAVTVRERDRTPSGPTPASRTVLAFSGGLAARAIVHEPERSFTAFSGDKLQPSEFLVSVAPDGRILHVVLQRGSGNAALDQAAAMHLMGSRVEGAETSEMAWGTAVFVWGSDVKRTKSP